MSTCSKNNRLFLFAIQSIIAFFIFLNVYVHSLPLYYCFCIFLYQYFLVYLLGHLIVRYFEISYKSYFEDIAFSYIMGCIISIVEYFTIMLLKIENITPILALIQIVVVVIISIRKRTDDNYPVCSLFDAITLIALTFYYLVATIVVSFVNSMPNETGGTGYYVDWLFWVGNNIGLTKTFPVDSFRQIGIPYKYHYFSSILFAQFSLATSISIKELSFYFSFILSGVILIFSSYSLCKLLINHKLLCFMAFWGILFSDGLLSVYSWHTIICPFGFDYALSFGIISLVALLYFIKKPKDYKVLFLSGLILAVTTGLKGPVALVMLSGFGVACIYMLCKQEFVSGIVSGIVWIIAFCSIFLLFVMNFNDDSQTGLLINSISNFQNPWVADIYSILLNSFKSNGNLFLKIGAICLYIVRVNEFAIVLACVNLCVLIYDKFHRKEFKIEQLICNVIVVTGVIMSVITYQSGGSQIYFAISIIPFAIVGGISAIERFTFNKRFFKEILCALLVSVFVFSSVIFLHNILPKISEGIECINNNLGVGDYRRCYVDKTDYDAFLWLYNNTDEDVIVAMDSFYDSLGRPSYLTAGVFSERYIWNEQYYAYSIDEAYRRNGIFEKIRNNPEETINNLIDEGVDYLMLNVENTNVEDDNKMVYSNEKYIIYKLD